LETGARTIHPAHVPEPAFPPILHIMRPVLIVLIGLTLPLSAGWVA